jgi:hypothetical protein
VYKKDGSDIWIEYWPGRDQWQLKPGRYRGNDIFLHGYPGKDISYMV